MNAKPPAIPMQPVKSSAIVSIGHSGDTLAVEYKGGRKYHYPGVSTEQFQKLQGADSVGSYLNQHIAPHHKAEKQDPDQ